MAPRAPNRNRIRLTGIIRRTAALLLLAPLACFAQSYPTRPITLVLPFPPGGLADLVARRVSQSVGTDLGQPIVIDSKAGGGGTIGPTYVKGAAPDGYTLLMGNNSTQAIHARPT